MAIRHNKSVDAKLLGVSIRCCVCKRFTVRTPQYIDNMKINKNNLQADQGLAILVQFNSSAHLGLTKALCLSRDAK